MGTASPPSLDDFYEGAEILMTGATGFLGKLLIEKLLRSFPRVKTIYVIVRAKKNQSPQQRIDKMLDTVIFERLEQEVPHFKLKIKVLSGQLEAPDLGLSPDDKRLVTSKVNLVFHCAATLRFDEELKEAIRTNMCATQTMLDLAKQCKNLKMFTYVSTAFSNSYRKNIEEIIYKAHTHYSELLKISKLDVDDPKYQETRERLSHENMNTYTLTKAAAEQLLCEEAQFFPVCIFRPSIVISTWKEPIPGWIDNLYGPTGLVTGAQAGVVRTFLVDPDVKADIVPADLVVNALICAPWNGHERFHKDPSCLPIYNYVNSKDNPLTWGEFITKSLKEGVKIPSSQTLWSYVLYPTRHKVVHYVRCLLLHYLFGYIFDLFAWISGNSLRLVPIYSKMDKVVSALEPFSTREWEWDNSNVQSMWTLVPAGDRVRFPFNIRDLDWDDYLRAYVRGTLVHHLQDKLDPVTRQKAWKRHRRLTIAHQCIKALLYMLLVLFLYTLVTYTLW
ncbi:hypothetical protein M8J76_003424 [Diaphorina citri]|nr:hypothetical protein M8J76_003424 [Diaphorina citri]